MQSQHIDWLELERPTTYFGNDVSWLQTLREEALDTAIVKGMPGNRSEDWRYTPLRSLHAPAFAQATSNNNDPGLSQAKGPRIVLVNGRLHSIENTDMLPKGAMLCGLDQASRESPDILRNAISSSNNPEQHALLHLNTAFATDGVFLSLADSVAIEEPIEIVYFHACEGKQAQHSHSHSHSHSRNLFWLGKHSRCQIIERHCGRHEGGRHEGGRHENTVLHNHVSQVVLEDGAHCEHYKLQQDAETLQYFGSCFASVKRSANYTNHTISTGGQVLRNELEIELVGEGAHAEFNGLQIAKRNQHMENQTTIKHAVAHTTSDQLYKSIVDDNARSVFKGRIIVAQDAQHTDANQQNKNLLLSPNAEADSKPQLEIYADDVKCAHGATVGQLDEAALFYLRSRGIGLDTARQLLTYAFAAELLERFTNAGISDELRQRIAGQLLDAGELL